MRIQSRVALILILTGLCCSAHSSESIECSSGASELTVQELAETPLPVRQGPRIQTSGRVPHVQIGFDPSKALNKELFRLAFTLPGLEERPTIVSLPGATGMWLQDGVTVERPKTIVSGREFAHIHPDGSLHAPLPLARAIELEKKGWGERHPWANRFDGWEGLVMLYSATTQQELNTLIQLVAESYAYVTGQSIQAPNC